MRKTSFITHRSPFTYSGFTFIEILIVIAVMATLFGLGLANFRGFQDRQQVAAATDLIKSDLRFTQSQALGGVKPQICNELGGYKVHFISSTSYSVIANCPGTTPADFTLKTISLSENYPKIQISSFSDIYFNVLGKGVQMSNISEIQITVQSTKIPSLHQLVTVTKGGEIK